MNKLGADFNSTEFSRRMGISIDTPNNSLGDDDFGAAPNVADALEIRRLLEERNDVSTKNNNKNTEQPVDNQDPNPVVTATEVAVERVKTDFRAFIDEKFEGGIQVHVHPEESNAFINNWQNSRPENLVDLVKRYFESQDVKSQFLDPNFSAEYANRAGLPSDEVSLKAYGPALFEKYRDDTLKTALKVAADATENKEPGLTTDQINTLLHVTINPATPKGQYGLSTYAKELSRKASDDDEKPPSPIGNI